MSSSVDRKTANQHLEELQQLDDIVRLIRSGVGDESLGDFDLETLQEWCRDFRMQRQYDVFSIEKRSGGKRFIHAPRYRLKKVQKVLNLLFSAMYQPRDNVHGFIPKGNEEAKARSIKTNAAKHVKQKWLLNVDIENFFPSIHLGRIRGVLMHPPFNLNLEVAHVLAQLCTYPTQKYRTLLPQGAPSSPVLSNLVCRGLDYDLSQLAREHRCYYTRYADDITFSTNKSIFPYQLATKEKDVVDIGDALLNIFKKHDFHINEKKTSLRDKSSRHRVTGLIINEKVNVPREYIMNTKAMLHSWETQGFENASARFAACDTRNRQKSSEEVRFNEVMRGRIEFIGSIRGKNDDIYHKLATKLAKLDPSFTYTPVPLRKKPEGIRIFTEGETDIKHLEAAQKALSFRLPIPIVEYISKGGEAKVKKALTEDKDYFHKDLHIFVFDRDNSTYIEEYSVGASPYKNHGNNVFSLVIPIPRHRSSMNEICIEHYYYDKTLKAELGDGRRLYTHDEFDTNTGLHSTDKTLVKTNPKSKSLIVDSSVTSTEKNANVALTKDDFANAIREGTPPFDDVDFTPFQEIFDAIQEILDTYN